MGYAVERGSVGVYLPVYQRLAFARSARRILSCGGAFVFKSKWFACDERMPALANPSRKMLQHPRKTPARAIQLS